MAIRRVLKWIEERDVSLDLKRRAAFPVAWHRTRPHSATYKSRLLEVLQGLPVRQRARRSARSRDCPASGSCADRWFDSSSFPL